MKTWKPDTCECLVEEIYEGTEIKGGGQILTKCTVHADVPDNELYGVLYANPDGENKRKNLTIRTLMGYDELDLGLTEEVENESGRLERRFKKGTNVDWSFSGKGKNRVLELKVVGSNLTPPEKNTVREHFNNKFGNGKVNLT